MTITDLERWKARIAASEATLLTPAVKMGADFLISARNDDHGWGQYKSLPLDLYSSSLALQALRSCTQQDLEPDIRSSTIALRSEILKRSENLAVVDLIASLRILNGVRLKTDDARHLLDQVVERLTSMRRGFGW